LCVTVYKNLALSVLSSIGIPPFFWLMADSRWLMADGHLLSSEAGYLLSAILAKCFAKGVNALGQYFTLFVELLMLALVDVSSILRPRTNRQRPQK
jgi:hypothetical protein